MLHAAPSSKNGSHSDGPDGEEPTVPIVDRSAELNKKIETKHGSEVLTIVARALTRAACERHGLMVMDHLLFALAERDFGANALIAAGITDVAGLEVELLNIVHGLPVCTLPAGEEPNVDPSVLAVLGDSIGYARRNGRDATTLADLLAAIADALRGGDNKAQGMAALEARWPRATEVDATRQLLLEIKDALVKQPATIAKVLAEELAALRDRVATLEGPRPASLPWYRRLNVLLAVVLAVAATSTGVGLYW